jgi:hypothetical protein
MSQFLKVTITHKGGVELDDPIKETIPFANIYAPITESAGGFALIPVRPDSTNTGAPSTWQTQEDYDDVVNTLSLDGAEFQINKDASGGYAGLTLFKINFKNALNTFISFFTNTNTAARTYTFPDKDGTVALTNDWEKVMGVTATNGVITLNSGNMTNFARISSQSIAVVANIDTYAPSTALGLLHTTARVVGTSLTLTRVRTGGATETDDDSKYDIIVFF